MKLIKGDCLEELKTLEDNSIDSIVTDPPYGLSFMGKKWDYDVPSQEIWEEALRVLKPGGYLLSFAGTRTYHRMAVRIEDAGFEIRDMISWLYGSGFPKSLNIGKSVNKLETSEWSKISKALNNIDQKSIMEVWKSNAKPAGIKLVKSLTGVGSNTRRKYFVQDIAVLYFNQEKENANAITAELNLCVPSRTSEVNLSIAVGSVEQNTELSQELVKSVVKLSESQRAKSWDIFTAECDVKEWLNENTEINHKVDEALKTLRGNKKYLNEEITNVLCAELTDILKHIILNQSKTFQSLDTKLKTECVSAINVIITEYTAENLISNTVAILKSKAIDKIQGNEREKIGEKTGGAYDSETNLGFNEFQNKHIREIKKYNFKDITKGNSPYEGWGTALKPAHEPICMARKPLQEKTVAENCLKYGTGGINIDECRVEITDTKNGFRPNSANKQYAPTDSFAGGKITEQHPQGRFPANIILDEEAGKMLDEQSGVSGSNKQIKLNRKRKGFMLSGSENNIQEANSPDQYGDKGGASRFFYCAKASKSERNMGCEGLEEKQWIKNACVANRDGKPTKPKTNFHPTVKPLKLMTYLIKLVTKQDGVVLDPFMGSGSTGIACKQQGYNFVGIERDEEYFKIAETRIENTKVDNKLF